MLNNIKRELDTRNHDPVKPEDSPIINDWATYNARLNSTRSAAVQFAWKMTLTIQQICIRLLDLALCLVLVIPALLLLILSFALMIKIKTRPFLVRKLYAGKNCQPILVYNLNLSESSSPVTNILIKLGAVNLPVLSNILAGQVSFIGPALVPMSDIDNFSNQKRTRFNIKPGLISPWQIRKRANIAFDDQHVLDIQYIHQKNLKNDLGIILKSLMTLWMNNSSGDAVEQPDSFEILDVKLDNWTMAKALEFISATVKSKKPETEQICFVNPDCLNISVRNREYKNILNTSSAVLPDGIGIHVACKILGIEMKDNVNGTDLFPRLCEMAAAEDFSIYLLGGRPGVADSVRDNLKKSYPELKIVGTRHGYFEAGETDAVISEIGYAKPDILLIAFGVPMQETWINDNRDRLDVSVAMGVGGLFDFYSGRIPRAPQWMREMGLEWLFRLIQEPKRMWRRYVIGNPLFLFRVLSWRRNIRKAQINNDNTRLCGNIRNERD